MLQGFITHPPGVLLPTRFPQDHSRACPLAQPLFSTQLPPLPSRFRKGPPPPARLEEEGRQKATCPIRASPTASSLLTPCGPCPGPRGLGNLMKAALRSWKCCPHSGKCLPFQGLPPPMGPQVNSQPTATGKGEIIRLEARPS